MNGQPEISQESQARREHAAWLEDYRRWRSEHRQALAMLTKVQSVILEREAALERAAAEVESHEFELQDYDRIGIGPYSPDPDKQIAMNDEFARQHENARAAYELMKRQHVNIGQAVENLFKMCQLKE